MSRGHPRPELSPWLQPLPCLECGATPTELAPETSTYRGFVDPCLGLLPTVSQACCGHGGRQLAFVEFEPLPLDPADPTTVQLREADALVVFRLVRALREAV